MIASVIILFALWIYPIISWTLLKLTKNRPLIRKRIFYASFLISGLSVAGLITNISTTLSVVDWIMVSVIYLTVSLILCGTQFQPNKFLKVFGIIGMICVFGVGYLSGTVGALGVGFIAAEYETDTEEWLGNGLIYKESVLGNAISDYRGKRVEIYKTIPWLPIIEWQKQQKQYYNVAAFSSRLTVDYKPEIGKIYLSASMPWGKDNEIIKWADTLTLKK